MSWQEQLNGDSLSWLLESDEPGVRFLAMRDLLELPATNTDLQTAQELAHRQGPIATVLNAMQPDGYWVEAGPGYNPKYRSTVWALILLAQLGASPTVDERVHRACVYLLENALTENGQFSSSGTPFGTVDCLQGNLCSAMLSLGLDDRRLEIAFDWMARSVTGEGIAQPGDKTASLRYYAGKCGPLFACGANNKLPCAWGGVKVMVAFGRLSPAKRTPIIQAAIAKGAEFLLNTNPAEATYPTGWSDKPSRNWWKFGFPVFYVTDLLQTAEACIRCGYGNDPRLADALDYIKHKQDSQGRWALDYDYTGKTWVDFGEKKKPNKWVTLRAAWVLKQSYRPPSPPSI